MKPNFEVELLSEAFEFIKKQDFKTRKKIFRNINRAKESLDPTLFKKLTNEIWEFRTLYNKKYFRIIAFWDKTDNQNTLVAATHGIYKTTSKILKLDIERAERIRKEYYHSKNK